LAYKSGNAAETKLSFVPSSTAGATYRAYLQQIGAAYLDTENIAATAAALATEITLPAITGYAGVARVILRAVSSGGVEEANTMQLALEYDAAGSFVIPRPNTAFIRSVTVTSGLNASFIIDYDSRGEAGTATTVKVYSRTPAGSYNFASADATGTLSGTGTKTATATASYAEGWYYITARAATSGGILGAQSAQEQYVHFSDDVTAAPYGDVIVSRG
jgi:hypothetical protein